MEQKEKIKFDFFDQSQQKKIKQNEISLDMRYTAVERIAKETSVNRWFKRNKAIDTEEIRILAGRIDYDAISLLKIFVITRGIADYVLVEAKDNLRDNLGKHLDFFYQCLDENELQDLIFRVRMGHDIDEMELKIFEFIKPVAREMRIFVRFILDGSKPMKKLYYQRDYEDLDEEEPEEEVEE